MFYSPCISYILFFCSLVVPIWYLVWCDIITSSWWGHLNFGLCIAVCVNGRYFYVMSSPLLKFCTYACVLVIFSFLVQLITPFVRTRKLLVLSIFCSLDDSDHSQDAVTLRNGSGSCNTYLPQFFTKRKCWHNLLLSNIGKIYDESLQGLVHKASLICPLFKHKTK